MPIEIKDLSYVYSPNSPFEKTALNKINLKVIEGEFLGIIGHTGSGKSTLVSHLNALTKIQSGIIIVDNIVLRGKEEIKAQKALNKLNKKNDKKGKGEIAESDGSDDGYINDTGKPSGDKMLDLSCVKKPDYRALRAKVGMVFQYPEYQLFDETVAKDVGFGPKNLGVGAEETAERVKQAIEMVGLDYESIKERSPFELSGGQKRRVAIAGVLAMRPQVLVLDEPTAGLDPRGKREILELIQQIKKDMCPTIIMISHNMDEIAEVSDRVAVMADGELKCIMPPAQLFSQADMLEKLNIQMPMVTKLAFELIKNGYDISSSIVTKEELVSEIARVKKGGKQRKVSSKTSQEGGSNA